MNILITGCDGYLGWPLAIHLTQRGHKVAGIDNYSRRRWVEEVGSVSAIPIAKMPDRLAAFEQFTGQTLRFYEGDLRDPIFQAEVFSDYKPDAVVYLGEMPSAPYSMMNVDHAIYTQTNNVAGTLATLFAIRDQTPHCHLVKLGTMGEYGTPNVDIPEGFFELEYRGRKARMMFPRQAGSWYHQSKVHDTHNVEMACRLWKLRATDIMQGVVYGTRFSDAVLPPELMTRFDFDSCFGTVLNRFCAQAVTGMPLTPYGKGSQKRGFLPLRDAMQCLTLALENPAKEGEYRTFNQFDRVYSVNELAESVRTAAGERGIDVTISPIENPRIEAEVHHYQPDVVNLKNLGYKPSDDLQGEIGRIIDDLLPNRERIRANKDVLIPKILWDHRRIASPSLGESPK